MNMIVELFNMDKQMPCQKVKFIGFKNLIYRSDLWIIKLQDK